MASTASRSKVPSLFDELVTVSGNESTRDAILAAASRVFIEHGFEGASMDLVAKAAGVARRTLYNQFPDGKESMFGAVAERMWRAFPVMDIATDESALSDPVAGLRRIGHGVRSARRRRSARCATTSPSWASAARCG
jgi:TetR/AcrR family transcriptional regulator of autoinduction and epiphytic fitness